MCYAAPKTYISIFSLLQIKMSKYRNIALPNELIERIDLVIKRAKLGYKTRGEFVKEAVRNLLKDLIK